MLSPTIAESKIKKAILKELENLSKVDADSELVAKIVQNGKGNTNLSLALAAIRAFFDRFSTMPLYEIFTVQGRDEVKDYLNNNTNTASVIDFLLRLKSYVFENKEIFEDVKNILHKDSVLDGIMVKEKTSLTAESVEDVKELYVLIIIYIYNNVGE